MKNIVLTQDEHRESSKGFHFFNLFQNCPWKFYIKYIIGLTPKHTGTPLIYGGAFHAGKETFYKSQSDKKAVSKIKSYIKKRKYELEDPSTSDNLSRRCETLLIRWIRAFGHRDLDRYEILKVEEQFEIELKYAPGFFITVKPDAILYSKKYKEIDIMETKTSSSSKRITELGVVHGDQATSYQLAVQRVYPKHDFGGVIPDIAYWNKQTDNPGNIEIFRSTPIIRTKSDLKQFEFGLCQILTDISARVQTFAKGRFPAQLLFPRNTSWCNSFSRACEYADVCRSKMRPNEIPTGFKHDPWVSYEDIIQAPTELKEVPIERKPHGKKKNGTSQTISGLCPICSRHYTVHANHGGSRTKVQDLARIGRIPSNVHRSNDHIRNLLHSWIFTRLGSSRQKRYIEAIGGLK